MVRSILHRNKAIRDRTRSKLLFNLARAMFADNLLQELQELDSYLKSNVKKNHFPSFDLSFMQIKHL